MNAEIIKNLFDEKEAKEFVKKYPSHCEVLALRLYTSRLLGKDPSLVLDGGGTPPLSWRSMSESWSTMNAHIVLNAPR